MMRRVTWAVYRMSVTWMPTMVTVVDDITPGVMNLEGDVVGVVHPGNVTKDSLAEAHGVVGVYSVTNVGNWVTGGGYVTAGIHCNIVTANSV